MRVLQLGVLLFATLVAFASASRKKNKALRNEGGKGDGPRLSAQQASAAYNRKIVATVAGVPSTSSSLSNTRYHADQDRPRDNAKHRNVQFSKTVAPKPSAWSR